MSEQAPQLQSWYLARGGEQLGPYAGEEFLRLAESGQLRADDLVWRPGFEGWKPVHAIAGLAAASPSESPSNANPDAAVQTGESAAGAKSTEVTVPAELEPTWKRVIAVWWLILWRSFVGGILAGLVMGWVVGFVLGFAGIPQSQITITAAIIGWIVGVVVNLVAVKMALKKHYAGFRLAMVPRDAP